MEKHNPQESSMMQKVSPKSHLIIDKKSFECIICYDFSINIVETSCCGVLICNFCSLQIKDDKCPICKKTNKFIESKSVKRLINNSISVCPFCEEELIFDQIPCHVKAKHMNKFEEILSLSDGNDNSNNEKNIEFLKLCFSIFKIDMHKKIPIHDHLLKIKLKKHNENFLCFIGNIMKRPNCEHKEKMELEKENINNENNINNEDNNNKEENNINNEKNKKEEKLTIEEFFENLTYYYCEERNFNYCLKCTKLKEINFNSKLHQHILHLSNRRTSWSCDGSKSEQKCKTSDKSYSYFDASGTHVRYRCEPCDFDLCEKCMYFHHSEENNQSNLILQSIISEGDQQVEEEEVEVEVGEEEIYDEEEDFDMNEIFD